MAKTTGKNLKGKSDEAKTEKKFIYSKFLVPVYLIVISALFYANYNAIFDEKVDMNGDNIYYYSLGRAMADGKGFTNVIGYEESPHEHFPPGYPAFISVLMKTGLSSIHAIKVANGFLLYLSLILLFFIFAKLSKNNIIAFVSIAFSASHAQLLRFSTIMMSEMLFIFLTALIIFIVLFWNVKDAFANRKKLGIDIGALVLLSVSLAYLYFVRTVGVSLMLAVLIYYGIVFIQYLFKTIKKTRQKQDVRQDKMVLIKYAVVCFVVILSILVPKMAWDARNRQAFGNAEISYLGDFMNKGGGEKMASFDDWKERIISNSTVYITKYIPSSIIYIHNYSPTDTKATSGEWGKGLFFVALMLLALFKSKQKGLLLFFYLGITFCVLLFYPEQFAGHRYMTPVMPFLIFLFIDGFYELSNLFKAKFLRLKAENKVYKNVLAISVCAIFFLIAQSSYSQSFNDIKSQARYKTYNERNAMPPFLEFIQATDWIAKNIPDTARIASRKPEIFYIFSGNRKCAGLPYYGTPEEVLNDFEKNKIDYVLIDWWFRHAYTTVVPCIQKYEDKFRIVHQIGGQNNQPVTYIVQFLRDK